MFIYPKNLDKLLLVRRVRASSKLKIRSSANYWSLLHLKILILNYERPKITDSKVYLLLQYLHCLTKTLVYITPYVRCTEQIIDSRPFMYNKIFLKKLWYKCIVLIFRLLLAPLRQNCSYSKSLKLKYMYVWKSTNCCYR